MGPRSPSRRCSGHCWTTISVRLETAIIAPSPTWPCHGRSAGNRQFASAADALKHLRQSFPQAPLETRVAAANLLMERQQRAYQP